MGPRNKRATWPKSLPQSISELMMIMGSCSSATRVISMIISGALAYPPLKRNGIKDKSTSKDVSQVKGLGTSPCAQNAYSTNYGYVTNFGYSIKGLGRC